MFLTSVGQGSIQKTLEAIVWHNEEMGQPGNLFAQDTANDEESLQRLANLTVPHACIAAVFTYADLTGTFGELFCCCVGFPSPSSTLTKADSTKAQLARLSIHSIT